MMRPALLLAALAALQLAPAPAAAAGAPHPLFASDDVVRLTISGPVGRIAREAERRTDAHPATLELGGPVPETHAIRLSARGLTRRRADLCAFPPLRLEFAAAPVQASLFRGQRRLKLVTHCRQPDSFQQYVLLEYAAYRLLNQLTPRSLRVRLAEIDYVDGERAGARTTRLGFLIEDVDDAARRNRLVEVERGNIRAGQLDRRDAARVALFQYMIGNLDWSMLAGPPGAPCCHNGKLLAPVAGAADGLVPVPYDFDHSGLVDAPYATPPDQVPVSSVRERRYRGNCLFNAEAEAAAAEALATRPALLATLGRTPHLSERSRAKATAYLDRFFADIASPAQLRSKLLRNCLSSGG